MSSPENPPLLPEDVSLARLADLYGHALFNVEHLKEAELLKIREEVVAEAVLLNQPDRFELRAYYGLVDEVDPMLSLELVNRINARSGFVRASLDDDLDLVLSHTILLKGGVTKKALLEATRAFLAAVPELIQKCDDADIVT